MTWPIQDHANAVLALLRAAPGSPALTVYDGVVPKSPDTQYVVVYAYVGTPDGETAPDKVPLTFNSDVIDLRIYCHCVGGDASAARAVSGRVRAALLNVTPTIVGRTCWPIRWREGQPPQRNEETLTVVMDQVDVYGLVTVPG